MFYTDPRVEENVQNRESWGKDWSISGLEISGKQVFLSLKYQLGLYKEDTVNKCPKAVKWLYLQCNFHKLYAVVCPGTPYGSLHFCSTLCP